MLLEDQPDISRLTQQLGDPVQGIASIVH